MACTILPEMYCCCCCCWAASVVSDSVWPYRRQPTRLPRPWDSPGKNTGMGCHFLLQCMKVKGERSRLVMSDSLQPMDCSLPGSSIHGIFQARVLEWGAFAFSTWKWTQRKGKQSWKVVRTNPDDIVCMPISSSTYFESFSVMLANIFRLCLVFKFLAAEFVYFSGTLDLDSYHL